MKQSLVLLALLVSASPSFAEVSSDLRFCGGLKSSAERLACYDAAARIAARPPVRPPVVADRAERPALDAQASLPTKAPILQLPMRSAFDGYYLAAGGGYGVGTGREARVSGNYTTTFLGDLNFQNTIGGSAHFAVGRNIVFDRGFVGFELAGRYGGEGESVSSSSFSFFSPTLIGSGIDSYRYRNNAAVHAAIRTGIVFDDLMIFAKAGIGASRIAESFTADERGISLFICPNRSPLGSCFLPGAPAPGIASANTTSWLPSAILGVGVEKNWGQFFGRLGADFEVINNPRTLITDTDVSGSSETPGSAGQYSWTVRGTAMVGVRF